MRDASKGRAEIRVFLMSTARTMTQRFVCTYVVWAQGSAIRSLAGSSLTTGAFDCRCATGRACHCMPLQINYTRLTTDPNSKDLDCGAGVMQIIDDVITYKGFKDW